MHPILQVKLWIGVIFTLLFVKAPCAYDDPYGILINEIQTQNVLPFIEFRAHAQPTSAGRNLRGYSVIIVEFNRRYLDR